jgi:hypothetical protein
LKKKPDRHDEQRQHEVVTFSGLPAGTREQDDECRTLLASEETRIERSHLALFLDLVRHGD